MAAAAVAQRPTTGDDSDASERHAAESIAALPLGSDRLAWLGLPALGFGDAVGHDESRLPGRGGDSVFVGGSAGPCICCRSSSVSIIPAGTGGGLMPWRRWRAWSGVIVVDQLITGGSGLAFRFWQELALHLAALFFLCMVCHGELVRRRPDPRFLTSFYLMIAAGGALGGMFVSLVAPHVFATFFEWRLGLVVGCLTSAWVWLDGQNESFFHRRFAHVAAAALLIFVGLSCAPQFGTAAAQRADLRARIFLASFRSSSAMSTIRPSTRRNFYSGRIVHGLQFVDAEKRHEPTAYYGRGAGVGQALAELADRPNLRIGAVGLGVGTIATYARPGDTLRFYEINPDVIRIAREHFSFLADCQGECDVVLGDARLSLEKESPQHFDLLVLDAFSGDAVPAHLLTREAFEIYRRHLQPDGMIAVHISNRYLDLRPVLAGLAEQFGYSLRVSRFARRSRARPISGPVGAADADERGRPLRAAEPDPAILDRRRATV